ncbi:MAG: lysylphosphatidylglycerol synthase transmembrane domain-containing protein [Anaerolineales bacterium]|nr:lysylphosphatidylglycerol synthase transmembrane domain-containing protein [Anaerolineales bacterium]
MENKTRQTFRIAFISAAAIALGIFLIKILLTYARLDLSSLFADIQNLPFWALSAAIFGVLFNIMLGAQNWRLTVERVSTAENTPAYLFYLAYSTMSAVLGLFIPIQLSNLIIRSLSLKFFGNASAPKSAVTALISQVHDVTVSFAFLVPGIMVIFWKINFYQWLFFEALLVAGMYILFSRYTFIVIQKVCALKFSNKIAQKIMGIFNEGLNAGLFDNSLMTSLYLNSFVKFIILALRAYMISSALGLTATFIQITGIFSALQLSVIFTITPGNLGVIEWGWVGLLIQTGISAPDAGRFALISRGLGYLSAVAVFVGVWIVFAGRKLRKV